MILEQRFKLTAFWIYWGQKSTILNIIKILEIVIVLSPFEDLYFFHYIFTLHSTYIDFTLSILHLRAQQALLADVLEGKTTQLKKNEDGRVGNSLSYEKT